jgi:hypothetical protein
MGQEVKKQKVTAREVSAIADAIQAAAPKAHAREALRNAYRCRNKWTAADVPTLLAIFCDPALERTPRRPTLQLMRNGLNTRRPGPGAIKRYRPGTDRVRDWIFSIAKLFDPATPRHQRLRLFKRTSIWPHIVEGVYRCELENAQRERRKFSAPDHGREEPSEIAEKKLAKFIGMSCATVHQLCWQARRGRAPTDSPGWPAMSLDELGELLETGDLPTRLRVN